MSTHDERLLYAQKMDEVALRAYNQAEAAVMAADIPTDGPGRLADSMLAIAKVGLATIANDRSVAAMTHAHIMQIADSVDDLREQHATSSDAIVDAVDNLTEQYVNEQNRRNN